MTSPETLTRENGATIAYHRLPGNRPGTPGLVFLGGFMSDMTGTKATELQDFARARGQAFLRFDYQGHGQSSGDFTQGTVGSWSEDAIAALDALTEGPQILVGSSMGGWIMLRVALARPERIAGLVGIAAAPDFTDRMWESFSGEVRETLRRDGLYQQPSDYSEEPYRITQALIEDGRRQRVFPGPIPITAPVRLLQGQEDTAVPWETALELSQALASEDVEVTLVKQGDHRLSEPADLERLKRTIAALSEAVE